MAPAGVRERHHAVILAGGRGVRFWPCSRSRRPKQLLAPLGGSTLVRRTFDRLARLFPPERIWVLTGAALVSAVASELGELPEDHIIAEPVQRNTAPALGLAACLLHREDGEAAMGVFPADHHLDDEQSYRALVGTALDATSEGKLIVLGIEPRWAETGYGYIEFPAGTKPGSDGPLPVVRFCEKPDLETARSFLAARNFYWNSGQFFWKASVLLDEMQRFLPRTRKALAWIASGRGESLKSRLAECYGACESISVDHGILEPSRRVAGFAAPEIGWTDLGSWAALHSLRPKDSAGNFASGAATFVRSRGNYVDAPGKHVALLGVDDLVVVETPDALLVCRRRDSQDVGSVVKALETADCHELL